MQGHREEASSCGTHPLTRGGCSMLYHGATTPSTETITHLCAHHRGERGCKIFRCVWHVKRAWLKHLQKKVAHYPARKEMLDELSAVLELRDMEKAEEAVDAFLSKWVRDF